MLPADLDLDIRIDLLLLDPFEHGSVLLDQVAVEDAPLLAGDGRGDHAVGEKAAGFLPNRRTQATLGLSSPDSSTSKPSSRISGLSCCESIAPRSSFAQYSLSVVNARSASMSPQLASATVWSSNCLACLSVGIGAKRWTPASSRFQIGQELVEAIDFEILEIFSEALGQRLDVRMRCSAFLTHQ